MKSWWERERERGRDPVKGRADPHCLQSVKWKTRRMETTTGRILGNWWTKPRKWHTKNASFVLLLQIKLPNNNNNCWFMLEEKFDFQSRFTNIRSGPPNTETECCIFISNCEMNVSGPNTSGRRARNLIFDTFNSAKCHFLETSLRVVTAVAATAVATAEKAHLFWIPIFLLVRLLACRACVYSLLVTTQRMWISRYAYRDEFIFDAKEKKKHFQSCET